MNLNLTDVVNNLVSYIKGEDTMARNIDDLSDTLNNAKRVGIIPKLSEVDYNTLITQVLASLNLKFIADEKQGELIAKDFLQSMNLIDEEIDYMQNFNSHEGYHDDDDNNESNTQTKLNSESQEPKHVQEDVQEMISTPTPDLLYFPDDPNFVVYDKETEDPQTPLSKNSRDIF